MLCVKAVLESAALGSGFKTKYCEVLDSVLAPAVIISVVFLQVKKKIYFWEVNMKKISKVGLVNAIACQI